MVALRLLTALIALSPPPDTGGFIIRLGNDTVGIERFVRTTDSITGEFLTRSPTTARISYVIRTTPDGSVTSYTIQPYESATPGAQKGHRFDYDFRGKEIQASEFDGAHTKKLQSMRNLPGTIPVYEPAFASYQTAIQRAIDAGGKPVPVASFYLNLIFRGTATRVAPDTVLYSTAIGTIRAHIDSAGRVLDATAPDATFKGIVTRIPSPDLDAYATQYVERDMSGQGLGPLSPQGRVVTAVGETHVVVDYGRPWKRGRTIFGGVVPYGAVWRTGANAATVFQVDRDVMIGSTKVPAGEYTLFSLPTADTWTLVISKKTHEWGTQYDSTADFARIPMRVTTSATPVEQFTIVVDPKGAMSFAWDTRVGTVSLRQK